MQQFLHLIEIKPIPTNKVAQKPGSYGAPVLKRAKAQAGFQGCFVACLKAPPVRVVTTKQAPPEVKKPPPPPPPREDDKTGVIPRCRTHGLREAWL